MIFSGFRLGQALVTKQVAIQDGSVELPKAPSEAERLRPAAKARRNLAALPSGSAIASDAEARVVAPPAREPSLPEPSPPQAPLAEVAEVASERVADTSPRPPENPEGADEAKTEHAKALASASLPALRTRQLCRDNPSFARTHHFPSTLQPI